MKTTSEPTEQDIKAHDAMMEALTNICAHYHLAQGWVDSLMPLARLISVHNPTIMPKLIKAMGEFKIAVKEISKKMVRDDDAAIDLMFVEIGRSISEMCKMDFDERNEFLLKLQSIQYKPLTENENHPV